MSQQPRPSGQGPSRPPRPDSADPVAGHAVAPGDASWSRRLRPSRLVLGWALVHLVVVVAVVGWVAGLLVAGLWAPEPRAALWLLLVVGLTVALWVPIVRRPRLELGPEGLVVHEGGFSRRRHELGWHELRGLQVVERPCWSLTIRRRDPFLVWSAANPSPWAPPHLNEARLVDATTSEVLALLGPYRRPAGLPSWRGPRDPSVPPRP